jgi:hypothetical protein
MNFIRNNRSNGTKVALSTLVAFLIEIAIHSQSRWYILIHDHPQDMAKKPPTSIHHLYSVH